MPKIKSIKRHTFEHKLLNFGEEGMHQTEYLSLVSAYDEKGNLVEEQKLNPGNEVEEIHTFNYNENGKLMSHVMQLVMDEATETLQNHRDEKGRIVKEVKLYGNDPGETTSYVYDDKDQVIEIHKTDEEGEDEFKEIIDYDEKGNLLRRTKLNASGSVIEKMELSYDDHGNILSKSEYEGENNLSNKTEYTYDEKNRFISSVQKTAEGKLTESVTCVYDERDNLVERNIRDFHPRIIKFTYDDKNQCIEEEIYDQFGNMSAKNIYEHDEYGNVITELNYNMDINRMSRESNSGHRFEYEFYVE